MAKTSGKKVACPELQDEGITLHVGIRKAKRRGQDRMEIHLSQDGHKDWRMVAAMAWQHGLKVVMEAKPDRKDRRERVRQMMANAHIPPKRGPQRPVGRDVATHSRTVT